MKIGVAKKALAMAVSGAALFLSLGVGCNEQDNNDNEDRPGVENTENGEQEDEEGEEGDEQGGG